MLNQGEDRDLLMKPPASIFPLQERAEWTPAQIPTRWGVEVLGVPRENGRSIVEETGDVRAALT
jgi:hypothetical protein